MIDCTLRVILAKRKMTQKRLQELTGIRPGTIGMMYHGTISRISVEYMDRICQALDCQPADLFEYIPDAAENKKA